jgi:integrase
MLSDAKARKALPGEKDYKLADGAGLFLLVRPNGSKLWRYKYRFAGKEKLLSFGAYPEVPLIEARSRREDARKAIRDGLDPSLEKKRQEIARRSPSDISLESLAREWHDLNKARWTPIHRADVLRSLERDIFPKLGRYGVADIDVPLLLEVLRPIERRGAIETAKRIRQRLSAVFVYAISRGLISNDPAAVVAKALSPMRKRTRQPAVTDIAGLRELLTKTEGSHAYPVTLLASRLLALTAQRPGVIRGTEWCEFENVDLDSDSLAPGAVWHIPAARMKLLLDRKDEAAFDHHVPLTQEAVDVLRTVRQLSGRGDLTFPGQRHAHKPLSENAIGYLYNRAGWHSRHVPHGWRAAFSTIMNERRPSDRSVIDMMLAHVPKDKVEAAYNRAEHMDRRRVIAEEWAKLLMEGMKPAADLLPGARR